MCVDIDFRESKQDFEEIHGRLRRGDIIGVKGSPGEGHVAVRGVVAFALIFTSLNG